MFDFLKKKIGKVVEAISKTEITEKSLAPILDDFKLSLLEGDVALVVADEICDRVKKRLIGVKIGRFDEGEDVIREALRETLLEILTQGGRVNLVELVKERKKSGESARILFVGFNGVGKTLTVAKVAKYLLDKGFSVVLACGDTYRAGAIEQLEEHAKRLKVAMIKRPYGADAASVAFDAIEHARAKKIDAVLIDTAGRAETNVNLMNQIKKVEKVSDPHLVIFVGDSLAGNSVVEQAEEFSKFVGVGASILSKTDADVKGGAAISIAFVTKKPIIFLGTGQGHKDFVPFEPKSIVDRLVGE